METDNMNPEAPASTNLDLRYVPLEEPEDGVFIAYSNLVNLDWTLYDVRLRFAELTQVPDDDSPTWVNQHNILLERVAVRLPWHQAKLLRDMLTGLIRNYEAANGELRPIKLAEAPEPPALYPPTNGPLVHLGSTGRNPPAELDPGSVRAITLSKR
jgi:hypothetical protein